jgi:hypothetical protein
MAVQRQGNVKGRAPSGHANQHAKLGCKEPITLILGQAPSTAHSVLRERCDVILCGKVFQIC